MFTIIKKNLIDVTPFLIITVLSLQLFLVKDHLELKSIVLTQQLKQDTFEQILNKLASNETRILNLLKQQQEKLYPQSIPEPATWFTFVYDIISDYHIPEITAVLAAGWFGYLIGSQFDLLIINQNIADQKLEVINLQLSRLFHSTDLIAANLAATNIRLTATNIRFNRLITHLDLLTLYDRVNDNTSIIGHFDDLHTATENILDAIAAIH